MYISIPSLKIELKRILFPLIALEQAMNSKDLPVDHAMGMFFHRQELGDSSGSRGITQTSLMRTCSGPPDREEGSSPNRITTLKCTAKITEEWRRANSVNVLAWPGQSPDLNPDLNICRVL